MAHDIDIRDRINPPEAGGPPPGGGTLYRVMVYRDDGRHDFDLDYGDREIAEERYRAACGLHDRANVRLVEVRPDGTIRDARPKGRPPVGEASPPGDAPPLPAPAADAGGGDATP